ncbi:hypothetical protein, variant [Capsaspora owczarzaki ATCC 30864]|uniref:Ubiquitin conjugation factor E4 core domain-containing protein n=1 Tax=Capsaspora owczarzaki (strain ATCC 30864) TaxID=595528 RepID=A0A0D2WXA6_CAPO3|nr:hypothetical protein, variant [Capsaspora owczarzaki ATCC 30864]
MNSQSADEIRAKRLARMGQASQAQSTTPAASVSGTAPASPPPAASPAPAPSPVAPKPIQRVTSPAPSQASPMCTSPVRPTTQSQAPETSLNPEWTHALLARVLEVSLQPCPAPLMYLDSLAAELLSESAPMQFTADMTERLLIERLAGFAGHPDQVLPFMFRAFGVCDHEQRMLPRTGSSLRSELLANAQQLLISYTGIFLQYPDSLLQVSPSFQPQSLFDQFVQHMIRDSDTPHGMPAPFLASFIARFEKEDISTVFHPILSAFSRAMRRCTLADVFQTYLGVLTELVGYKSICTAIVSHPDFLPEAANGREFESKALLAPFFALSAFPDAVAAPTSVAALLAPPEPVYTRFFADPTKQLSSDVQAAMASVRSGMRLVQEKLHTVMLQLLKPKDEREKVLDFFSRAISINAKRAQMRASFQHHSTDGFCFNLVGVLLRLSDKFADPINPNMAKIDNGYLLHPDSRVHVGDETKIAAAADEVSRWIDQRNFARTQAFQQAQKKQLIDDSTKITEFNPPNFITECFYMTMAAHHIGVVATHHKLEPLFRNMQEIKTRLEQIEGQRAQWQGTPQAAQYEQAVKKLKSMEEEIRSQQLAYETILADPDSLLHTLSFYSFVAQWLLKIVDPKNAGLPLPEALPQVFASLPEYFVEDIAEFLVFVTRMAPNVVDRISLDPLIRFIVTFIASVSYIRNPYLRAKLVEIITRLTPEFTGQRVNRFGQLIERHPLAIEHLTPSLIQFFADVENTGSHTQFYDKFNIRYNIAQIVKNLWTSPDHLAQLVKSSTTECFVRYINLLMTDVTFLIDEAMAKLGEIRDIDHLRDNAAAWAATPQEERQSREAAFNAAENQVKSYLAFGKEMISMFMFLTQTVPEAFLLPEMIDRLAPMLDHNLVRMAGPDAQKLKVKNADKYGWNPRQFIVNLVQIFLNLAPKLPDQTIRQDFVRAMARDGRSFQPDILRNAVDILSRHSLAQPDTIEHFASIVQLAEDTLAADKRTEVDLGEIPDEFLGRWNFLLHEGGMLLS